MASSYSAYGALSRTPQSSQSPALIAESQSSARERKKKQQQPRQLLSCTKCRERKVKCDRTKPCSACCARGLPKECHFVLGEGTEFGPIQQSLELRKLRSENQRLKERLLAAKVSLSDSSDDDDGSSTGKSGPTNRRTTSRQKRFRTGDQTESLYFGSPGLASVISDFANLHVEPKSLAFTTPRGSDIYANNSSMYPFPALWQATTATQDLVQLLESHENLLSYLDTFADKAVGFAFPFLPENLSRREVEHFLQDREQNGVMYPDLLALIFAASALGIQMGGGDSDMGEQEDRSRRGDVFISAAIQALRASAFLSRPSMRSLQALLIVGPYLTNSGRFLDAWSLFGLTIRLAQSIGLHRNPKYLDPVPELKECTTRSTLWWWMLHVDQQYSMMLGRPLGISGIGDCPPPEPLTTNPAVLRLGEFVDQLTILGRQILSSSQLSDTKIDMFTDKLIALWDTMPDSLQFNEAWINDEAQIPEWPLCGSAAVHYCKINSYIILLNRQRIENTRGSPDANTPSPKSYQGGLPYYVEVPQSQSHPHTINRGRPMVLQSSSALLTAFLYFFKHIQIALTDWTIGQQAFNACMILILDALETGDVRNIGKVEQGYMVFLELGKNHTHQLAELAVSRISEGLLRLKSMVESRSAASGIGSQPQGRNATPGILVKSEPSGDSTGDWNVDTNKPEPSYYNESVMGSTGMFLLEDQSMRSFDASAPLPSSTPGSTTSDFVHPSVARLNPIAQPMQQNPPREQQMRDRYIQAPSTSAHRPQQQSSPFAVGLQPRFLPPRRDSVTAGSSQMPGCVAGPSSPPSMRNASLYATPTIQAPQQFQSSQQHYQYPQPGQVPQQMSAQEWQALRMQPGSHQMPPARGSQAPGPMQPQQR